jgi:hypothetical protein
MLEHNPLKSANISITSYDEDIRFFGKKTYYWNTIDSSFYFSEKNIGAIINSKDTKLHYAYSIRDESFTSENILSQINVINIQIYITQIACLKIEILKLYQELYTKLYEHGCEAGLLKILNYKHIYMNNPSSIITTTIDENIIDDNKEKIHKTLHIHDKNFYNTIINKSRKIKILLEHLREKIAEENSKLYTGPYRRTTTYEPRIIGLYIWDLMNIQGYKTRNAAVREFRSKYKEASGLEYIEITSSKSNNYFHKTDKCINSDTFLPITTKKGNDA